MRVQTQNYDEFIDEVMDRLYRILLEENKFPLEIHTFIGNFLYL